MSNNNVSPKEWKALLHRSNTLQSRARFDPSVWDELSPLNERIRILGELPANGSPFFA